MTLATLQFFGFRSFSPSVEVKVSLWEYGTHEDWELSKTTLQGPTCIEREWMNLTGATPALELAAVQKRLKCPLAGQCPSRVLYLMYSLPYSPAK